jgi:hypothetical protein
MLQALQVRRALGTGKTDKGAESLVKKIAPHDRFYPHPSQRSPRILHLEALEHLLILTLLIPTSSSLEVAE